MRIKLFLLAVVAALATSMPVQAGAILGYGLGNTQNLAADPATPQAGPPGAFNDPNTLIGFSDWSLGTRMGTTNGIGLTGSSAILPWNITVGQQYILQIQLQDTEDVAGNNATFQFPNINQAPGPGPLPPNGRGKLQTWGVAFNYAPGVATASPEADPAHNALSVGTQYHQAAVGDPTVYANLAAPNSTVGPGFFGVAAVVDGWSGFGAVHTPHNYVLANLVITAVATGDGVFSMTRPSATSTQWSSQDSLSAAHFWDAAIFATIPQLFIHVNPVPEPSSMALAGLAVSGLVIRLRRKKAVTA